MTTSPTSPPCYLLVWLTSSSKLGDAIREVVVDRRSLLAVLADLELPPLDRDGFAGLLQDELRNLQPYNCARYRLSIPRTEQWIRQGRPGA